MDLSCLDGVMGLGDEKSTYESVVKYVRLVDNEDYERFMVEADKVWPPVTEGAMAVTSFSQLCANTPNTQQLITDVIKAKEILGAGDNCWVYGAATDAVQAIPYARQLPEYKGKSVYEIVESLKAEVAETKYRRGINEFAISKFVQVYDISPIVEVGCTPECSWQSVEGAHACKNLLKEDKQVGLETAKQLRNKSTTELAAIAADLMERRKDFLRHHLYDPAISIATALSDVPPGPLRDDLALLMQYRSLTPYIHDNAHVVDVRSTPYHTFVIYKCDTPVYQPQIWGGHGYEYVMDVFSIGKWCGPCYYTFVETEEDKQLPVYAMDIIYDLQWLVRDDPAYFEAVGQFTADEDECPFSERLIMQDGEGKWIITPDWREKLADMLD